MDFLALFVTYLLLVLASIILVCIYSGRKQSFPARGLSCITQVFSFIIPTWLQRATKRVLHRLVHTRSCLFIVLHLALQVAVYGEYTWEVFGYCLELEFNIHFLLLPYLLLAVNMGFFILCSVTNPGTIMQSNQESFLKAYAYDGVMFQKSTMCPTCNVEKPARSKHCRRSQTKFVSNIAMLPLYYSTGVYQICVCNSCVHRFDHHCVWVNNCIGAFNTRYFLVYLFTLTAMAADIAIITAAFLIHVVLLSNMMLGSYIDDQGQEHTVEILFLIQHLFLTFPRIVFMLGFVIVLFLVLGAYCCFTLYLALTNQTSNEWYKSRRYDCSCCRTLQPHDRHVYRNVYSQGVWVNVKEIFKPLTNTEKKKKT